MKTLLIDGKEYKLDYSFGACFNTTLIKDMFNILTASYYNRQQGEDKTDAAKFFDAISSEIADVPRIVLNAFIAGLKDNHKGITDDDAKELLKIYMKDHKYNFRDVFEVEKECMEEDDFFEKSGILQMINDLVKDIENMNQELTEELEKMTKTTKKKSTSTK